MRESTRKVLEAANAVRVYESSWNDDLEGKAKRLNAQKVEVVEAVAWESHQLKLIEGLLDDIAQNGGFGRSLNRYLTAKAIMRLVLTLSWNARYLEIGDGRFTTREIAESETGSKLGWAAPVTPYPHSPLESKALGAFQVLLKNGLIEKDGHSYQMADISKAHAAYYKI